MLTVAKGEGCVKEEIQGGGCGQKTVSSTWGALWWQNYYASCLCSGHMNPHAPHTLNTDTQTHPTYTYK